MFCCYTNDTVMPHPQNKQILCEYKYIWTPLFQLLANDAPDNVIIAHIEMNSKSFLEEVDNDNQTALHYACKHQRTKIVVLLLQYNVNTNEEDWDGVCPLHYAARSGNSIICSLLLSKGAQVDRPVGKCDMTPLHIAYGLKYFDIVDLLVGFGAYKCAVDANNLTTTDYFHMKFTYE